MKITPFKSPNMHVGRNGNKPIAIVVHMSEGSSLSTLQTMASVVEAKSYHYCIRNDGEIIEVVKPDDTAWHAGNIIKPTWSLLKKGVNPNEYTIGICLMGFAHDGPSIMQMAACAHMIRLLSFTHKIELTEEHIIPHNRINGSKGCPGTKVDIKVLLKLAGLAK